MMPTQTDGAQRKIKLRREHATALLSQAMRAPDFFS
jgi:hypothetical protein